MLLCVKDEPQVSDPAKCRLNDVVFASSRKVRLFCNKPRKLALAQYGKYAPPHFDEIMEKLLAEKTKAGDPVFAAYEGRDPPFLKGIVKAREAELRQHYTELSDSELKTLITFTANVPAYYEDVANACYTYSVGEEPSPAMDMWMDFVCHMDSALKKLAASRPLGPRRLFRVARIPKKVWEEHFKDQDGTEVYFAAPMSASTTPRWEFLSNVGPDEVGCLLEFDERIAAMSGCLSSDSDPISFFPIEREWTLPSFVRGKIDSISTTSKSEEGVVMKTRTGDDVPHVKINSIVDLPPARGILELPTSALLDGATVLGLLTSTLNKKSPVLECLNDVYTCLQASLELKPDAYDVAARVKVVAKIPVAMLEFTKAVATTAVVVPACIVGQCADQGGDQHGLLDISKTLPGVWWGVMSSMCGHIPEADRLAQEQAKKERNRLANELTLQELERLAGESLYAAFKEASAQETKELERDPVDALRLPLNLAGQYLHMNDDARRQIKILPKMAVFNRLVATFLDAGIEGTHHLTKLYGTPFPYSQKAPAPLESLARSGDEIWMPVPDDAPKADHAKRAWAKLDVLRVLLSTSRLVVLVGMPNVGKSNFLEKVFSIETKGVGLDKAKCTHCVTAYKHPLHSDSCNTYIIDCPGYGDVKEDCNTTVNALIFATRNFVGACHCVWMHKADRGVKLPSDDLLKAVHKSISLIVVTHADLVVEQYHRAYIANCDKDETFDFDSDEGKAAMREEERSIMQQVKDEVDNKLRQAFGETELPEVVYACLGTEGWLCTEKTRRQKQPPPQEFQHSVDEVKQFFSLSTAKELRSKIDTLAGLPV